ncbi:MAG: hypothetical protein NT080_05925 [Spirochaetes bacterium]|nr:hypothetical protein [Spirochaetota bacterium]
MKTSRILAPMALLVLLANCSFLPRTRTDVLARPSSASGFIVEPGVVEVECGAESGSVKRELERLLPSILNDRGFGAYDGTGIGRVRLIVDLCVIERQFLRGAVFSRSIAIEAMFRLAETGLAGNGTSIEGLADGRDGTIVCVIRRTLESEDSVASSFTLSALMDQVVTRASAELETAPDGKPEP